MTKTCANEVLDEGLEYIQTNCDKMTACSAAPATYSAAVTSGAYNLAEIAMDSGDFTVEDHPSGGRRCVVAEQVDVTIIATDTATHIALVDTVGGDLLYVTQVSTPLYLTSGQTVTFPSWTIRLDDPV